MSKRTLLITADDYGYSSAYNAGVLEAARAAAIDAASAMVLRPRCEPAPLLATGIEIGLHLELGGGVGEGSADPGVRIQVELFTRLFGRPPSHLDGHHHCHAADPQAGEVEVLAAELGIRVRSVDEAHRRRLRERGVDTPERLLGRLRPAQPALPAEVEALRRGGNPPPGLTEWMVHPGRPDAVSGSRYDEARAEDLELLLSLASDPRLRALRGLA